MGDVQLISAYNTEKTSVTACKFVFSYLSNPICFFVVFLAESCNKISIIDSPLSFPLFYCFFSFFLVRSIETILMAHSLTFTNSRGSHVVHISQSPPPIPFFAPFHPDPLMHRITSYEPDESRFLFMAKVVNSLKIASLLSPTKRKLPGDAYHL
ncbi:unnamed protein product [Acanthosepion pharaonis]|uniref:Uncharacterized protein n=1 Tax=Acanthosepion pharaonis TaxID=158019 RepID=A0A812E660_ACAPH|nr:unnamed protein product [Sepia pharaonis]